VFQAQVDHTSPWSSKQFSVVVVFGMHGLWVPARAIRAANQVCVDD